MVGEGKKSGERGKRRLLDIKVEEGREKKRKEEVA